MRLSYSQWNTYNDCPFKWKAKYQLGVKGSPPGPAAERGTNIHNMIEFFIRGKSQFLPWDEVGGISKVPALGRQHPLDGVVRRIRDWPNGEKYVEKKVGFNMDWDPYPYADDLTAFITIFDAATAARGIVEIAEWKSGKPKASYADQRLLYALAAHRIWLPKEVIVTTYYVDMTSDAQRIRVPEASVKPLMDLWSGRRQTMMNDKIHAPRPNDGCKWCDARRSAGGPCPMPY